MGLPPNGTYEIMNHATGLYFDLKGSSIAPNNNIIGYPRTGGLNQKVKQIMVRIQAYIDTWFAVGPRKRGQHHCLAQPYISPSGCRWQGPCCCSFSLTVRIRELSHGDTGKWTCRSSSTWTVWNYRGPNWVVQVSEDNKLRYSELNVMLHRIKVIGGNLFFRLASSVPGTPVCYFRPKFMNRQS